MAEMFSWKLYQGKYTTIITSNDIVVEFLASKKKMPEKYIKW